MLGDILILFAVISWSLYTALGKPIVERYGSLESTFIIMTFGMFMYFPVGFTFAILNDYAVFTINNLIALLTLGIFSLFSFEIILSIFLTSGIDSR